MTWPPDDGAGDRQIIGIGAQVCDEAMVDLEDIDRQ